MRWRANTMSRMAPVGILALLLLGLAVGGFAQQGGRAGAIRVVLQPGNVARQRGNQVVRTTAQKEMPVFFRDVLETGVGGRIRARLDDGSILAVGSQSRLTVAEHNTRTQQTSLELEYGKVRAQVVRITRPGGRFDVRTNTAVAGVLGTDEVIDAFSPVATRVLCVDGLVEVRNSDPTVPGTVVLNPGQVTIVQQGLVPTPARPATPDELQNALEGSSGAAPQAIADLGTGIFTAGQDVTLSAADSFATGTILNYQWVFRRAADNFVVFNQGLSTPRITVDTTTWTAGNYTGTLTITTSANQTASSNFGFVVLPAALANTSPDEVIRQMQVAYETLQPSEFMKLFDPQRYSGYAALQQSVEASFRNLAQARVFVRKASGQIFEQGKVAIYQVDFEIQFSTKTEPDKVFISREQATLRMESGSGWLISDVPQGRVGGGGLVGVPGVADPKKANSAPPPDNPVVTPRVQPQGERVVVVAGGSSTFPIQNTSPSEVTITFAVPPGITLTGGGVQGTTFTIPAGQTLDLSFGAAASQSAGTVAVSTTITSGGSSLPGPAIPVTVVRLSLAFPAAGGSAANRLPVLLGLPTTTTVQVSSTVSTGHTVSLAATGGQVTASFSPNPVQISGGNTSANSTVILTPAANAQPGLDQVTVEGAGAQAPVSAPLFINRIAPFSMALVGPPLVSLQSGQSAQIQLSVGFNAPFAGPVQIAAPAGAGGVTFTPPSVTVTAPGTVFFTATGGVSALAPTLFTFTGTAGTFNQTQSVTLSVQPAILFSLSANPSSLTLAAGQSAQLTAQVALVSGTPQAVAVSVDPASVPATLSVTGGGTVPNASGSATFTVTAQSSAVPGSTLNITLVATAGPTRVTLNVPVTIQSLLVCSLSATPSALSLQPGQSGQVLVRVSLVSGTARAVDVSLVSGSVETNLLAVTGGGSAPNASGTVSFTVSVPPDAPPGGTAFRVTASCASSVQSATPPETQIAVTVLGGFQLSGPSAVSVVRGQSTPAPIELIVREGFNAPLSLTVSCDSSQITASTPSTLPAGQRKFDVTITASATAAGPATCTLAGVSGTARSEVKFSVLIGSFTLSTTAPAQLPLFIGTTASFSVTVTPAAGFTADVQLTAITTAALNISPSSIVVRGGNGTVSFELTASEAAQAGLEKVTITGTAAGGLSSALEQTVQVAEGFSLQADRATFFLGNASPLTIRIERGPGFQSSVAVAVGTLPRGIQSVTPTSIVAASGTSTVTFQVTATADASLTGQTATIPITGTAVTATVPSGVGRAGAGPGASLVSLAATGTLQAPFQVTASGSTALGPVKVGDVATATVSVTFLGTPPFPGPVEVSGSSGAGFSAATPTVRLAASGIASISFIATDGGGFLVPVRSRAGTFDILTNFTLNVSAPPPPPPSPPPSPPPPPPPSFQLCVSVSPNTTCLSDTSFVDVNGSIPVALQVKILPLQGFSSSVTVSVTDGSVMKFYAGCGGTSTFTIAPPYAPVAICMSAGTPLQPTTENAAALTATPAGGSPDTPLRPTFRIGVPALTVTPLPFTIPAAGASPGSVTLTIALGASSPTNVFNLPMTVFITGPGSGLSGTGPVKTALPTNLASADCGPTTSGKPVSPGGSTTCTITNSATTAFSSGAGAIEVFVTYGPGASGFVLLGASQVSVSRTKGETDKGPNDARPSDAKLAGLTISPEKIAFSPLLPKEGDKVTIQARVENKGEEEARDVAVALVVNKQAVARQLVTVAAGGSQTVQFEWEAAYDPRLSVELSVRQGDESLASTAVRNLRVEPGMVAALRQGRSSLEVANGNCAGFRLLLGVQTSCGGSSDIEVSSLITADGQLRVQVLSLNGGIVDLGPGPITGRLTVPDSGYAAKGMLESGHLYAVESHGKYGLLYVARIQSDIDPRLARLTRGSRQPAVERIDDLFADRLDSLLDQARTTVILEWAYRENGSRQFEYGFSGAERTPRPGLYRQPRSPDQPVAQ